jgi:hypothetical protein
LDSSKGGEILEFEKNLIKCKNRIEIMSGFIPRLPFKSSDLEISEKYIGKS